MKIPSSVARPFRAFILTGLIPVLANAQGSLVSWGIEDGGLQDFGQVSDTPSGTDFKYIATGARHSLAVRTDGSIVAWGEDYLGTVSNTPGGTGFIQVAAGSSHSLALRVDGAITSWGHNVGGLVVDTPVWTGFTQIASGYNHSLALHADGWIAAWGHDVSGVVSGAPSGTGYIEVAGGANHALALRSDGSIVAWGSDYLGEVYNTPSGTGFVHVAAGSYVSLALHADGSLVSWGTDFYNTVTDTPSGTGFTQITAGHNRLVALRGDGSIVSWGHDTYGILVSGTPSGTGFTQVVSGSGHSLALLANDHNHGEPYCFGDGSGSTCPCSGFGLPGEGCSNSGTAGGARLTGSGHGAISVDNFQLDVTGVFGNKPGLILRGVNQLNGGFGNPVGDGLLCVGGQTARSQVQVTSAGSTTFADFHGQPFSQSSYGVGVPTNYQFWYRDPGNSCSGNGFNFSNALAVVWLP